MQEKVLLRIALIVAVIGLAALYFFSTSLQLEESDIEKITLDNTNDIVKIRGVVTEVHETDAVVILEVTQPHSLKAVMFKYENKSLEIQEGSEIEVFGEVAEYEGNPELIVNRARVIG